MSDVTMPSGGLRERKRAATRSAIEHTAISLALEHGYERITVDMICEASMVSQRTFFNYFGSKEGVILGAFPPMPSDDEIDNFVRKPRSNVLSDFLALVASSILDQEVDAEMFRARRTLITRTPELLTKATARMAEFEDQFVAVILSRYESEGRHVDSEAGLEDEARMVVALSAGAMNFVMRKWLSAQPSPPTRELLGGAIELMQRVSTIE